MMRTTIVLEDDVLAALQQESRKREASFRETLNAVISEGLAISQQRRSATRTFQVRPRAMGLRPGLSYDSVSKLIGLAEGDGAR